jgi:hypothetical protein
MCRFKERPLQIFNKIGKVELERKEYMFQTDHLVVQKEYHDREWRSKN